MSDTEIVIRVDVARLDSAIRDLRRIRRELGEIGRMSQTERSPYTPATSKVFAYIETAGRVRVSDIPALVGLSRATVHRALAALHSESKINWPKNGYVESLAKTAEDGPSDPLLAEDFAQVDQ